MIKKLRKFFNFLTGLIFISSFYQQAVQNETFEEINHASDLENLFPKTVDEIDRRFKIAKDNAENSIKQILSIATEERTFENTILAFDKAIANFAIYESIISMLKMVHPQDTIRQKAQEIVLKCSEIEIDLFYGNKNVYQACKEYQSNSQANNKEPLNKERDYYFSNLIAEFKMAGFELENEKFEKLQELRKKIAGLSIQFQTNISQDNSKVCFQQEDLVGLDNDFIESLIKNDEGYILACDYPTVSQVMSNCSIESTRQRYSTAFKNRAFPENIDILNQIINTRDELAHILGYNSYAALDVASTMAETIDCVETFLNDTFINAEGSIHESWKQLLTDLPESITLTSEGKIKLWDVSYISNYYLKKHLQVDQEKIAEFFPMQKTVAGLLGIYEQFFNIKFEVINVGDFWDSSAQVIKVKNNNDNQIIGYVLADLFPRENKYSHAACSSIIPPISLDKGKTFEPAFAVVIANFSKPTETKPSLLKHDEVRTFFHEFGHAIHALFGKAEMPTRAGYNTKFDFVEMPSQLLEEWIWDRHILKKISCHYQTGKPLSDNDIEQLIKTKNLKEALSIDTNLFYSRLCLNLYKEGQDKDFSQIKKDAYYSGPQIFEFDKEINALCAITHLTGYGPKYYTYLWSEQLAKKIFDYIKLHGGLLDPVMGKRYIAKVIGRGGSCHPKQLIDDFLAIEFN